MTSFDSRIYLDYNATSPLTNNVKRLLVGGDFLFANPSSQHSSGKKAVKVLKNTTNFLKSFFCLDQTGHEVFFHSGATEAINTVFNLKSGDAFIYFVSDHPCVHAVAKKLKDRGVLVEELPIETNGHLNLEETINSIKSVQKKINQDNTQGRVPSVWMNYTYMHNETGVIWNLKDAVKIKDETGIKVHVDAVQSVGKVKGGNLLEGSIDVYTFSGHKFGSLKGVGFSFYKEKLSEPLILGGGQQDGVRSGTINTHGIQSIYAALNGRNIEKEFEAVAGLKQVIISLLDKSPRLEVVPNDSSNTICFLHESVKADIMLIHFDLAGLDVSSGSACSAGSVEPSKTLLAMGKAHRSANNIRISLGEENLKEKDEILAAIEQVIKKL